MASLHDDMVSLITRNEKPRLQCYMPISLNFMIFGLSFAGTLYPRCRELGYDYGLGFNENGYTKNMMVSTQKKYGAKLSG